MDPMSREVARMESQGVVAVVEWEARSDGYNVTVTRNKTSHTYHDIPYFGAALHQVVDGMMTILVHGED